MLEELERIRDYCNFTQAAMVKAMGVPLRTYEDWVAGKSKVRPVHLNAARYVQVEKGFGFIESGEREFAPLEVYE